jgi:hypothetical protein
MRDKLGRGVALRQGVELLLLALHTPSFCPSELPLMWTTTTLRARLLWQQGRDPWVERTGSWHNAHKKLVWCTERVGRVIDFCVAFSEVVIIVRRLIREAWSRYRWQARPSRRP